MNRISSIFIFFIYAFVHTSAAPDWDVPWETLSDTEQAAIEAKCGSTAWRLDGVVGSKFRICRRAAPVVVVNSVTYETDPSINTQCTCVNDDETDAVDDFVCTCDINNMFTTDYETRYCTQSSTACTSTAGDVEFATAGNECNGFQAKTSAMKSGQSDTIYIYSAVAGDTKCTARHKFTYTVTQGKVEATWKYDPAAIDVDFTDIKSNYAYLTCDEADNALSCKNYVDFTTDLPTHFDLHDDVKVDNPTQEGTGDKFKCMEDGGTITCTLDFSAQCDESNPSANTGTHEGKFYIKLNKIDADPAETPSIPLSYKLDKAKYCMYQESSVSVNNTDVARIWFDIDRTACLEDTNCEPIDLSDSTQHAMDMSYTFKRSTEAIAYTNQYCGVYQVYKVTGSTVTVLDFATYVLLQSDGASRDPKSCSYEDTNGKCSSAGDDATQKRDRQHLVTLNAVELYNEIIRDTGSTQGTLVIGLRAESRSCGSTGSFSTSRRLRASSRSLRRLADDGAKVSGEAGIHMTNSSMAMVPNPNGLSTMVNTEIVHEGVSTEWAIIGGVVILIVGLLLGLVFYRVFGGSRSSKGAYAPVRAVSASRVRFR